MIKGGPSQEDDAKNGLHHPVCMLLHSQNSTAVLPLESPLRRELFHYAGRSSALVSLSFEPLQHKGWGGAFSFLDSHALFLRRLLRMSKERLLHTKREGIRALCPHIICTGGEARHAC